MSIVPTIVMRENRQRAGKIWCEVIVMIVLMIV